MELKAILAIVLCLVIIGGAVYLHIKRKRKYRRGGKGTGNRPFLSAHR